MSNNIIAINTGDAPNDITIITNPSLNINVTTNEPSLILDTSTRIAKGEQGERGEQGLPGASYTSEEYTQLDPSTEWIINHNKGYYPTVTVLDLFNRIVGTEIKHISINQVRIVHDTPQSGKVIIN